MLSDKKKILTFSFDDGNVDDIKLVEILNRYGLKCTFNLNSARLTNNSFWRLILPVTVSMKKLTHWQMNL